MTRLAISKNSYLTSFILVIFGLLTLNSCKETDTSEKSILLYGAAGIKPAIEKIAKDYYQEYGVRVDIQYGGSGTLLANLRIAGQGDLYLAGDKSYIDEAEKFGLIDEVQPLAYIKPVIAVAKGNPEGITQLEDLFRKDIKICMANPDVAAIGKATKEILETSGDWAELEKNITVFMPTVNEVANSIKIGATDAGIIWDATANQYDNIEMISLPVFETNTKSITIAVLKSSSKPTEALRFLRYLSARDKGLPTFKQFGYQAIDGDLWEYTPEILFYSGGVNRVAIEQTIRAFEEREGVEVIRVYNGCGILVSQMKAGEQPDAYLSCDVSFMSQVENRFTDITDISNTDIIIATQKGNPKNIQSLNDLSHKGLMIGVCNHQQSALGALTKDLLEKAGLWEAINVNIRSQTPTADLLVNQLRTGSLDAVIVYAANVSKVKDKITVVNIHLKEANALQNFGVSINSNHTYLVKRLLKSLTAQSSKDHYLENGFNWEYDQ